jgi:hypothetical protein
MRAQGCVQVSGYDSSQAQLPENGPAGKVDIYLIHGDGGWITTALILAASGYALYRFACGYAVGPWGESVRSAFDLYRLDLLRQLGLYSTAKGHTLEEEQDLWYSIQNITMYGREDPEYPVRFTLTKPDGPEEQADETK